MKNLKTILILSALMFSWLVGVNNSSAAAIAATLKGKILLQVEQKGQAWYVNPTNALRYYLGRPVDAFNVMKELGLGISTKDLVSFNGYAPKRLSGRILLQVEDFGKAWYVNPDDLKLYYLGKPADAFRVMRELGLGITDKNLGLINILGIVGWKTYSNAQYGFSIQYPSEAQITDTDINGDRTLLFTSGGRNISFITSQGSVMVKVMKMAWNNGVLSSPPNCNDTAGGQDRTNTTINGIDFLTFSMSKELSGEYGHASATEYCAIQNGTVYKLITRVDYAPGSSNGLNLDKNATLNQMISTFKLIDSSDITAGWKTYTNVSQGFSFKYPEKLPTNFIHAQIWPPSVKITTGNFLCNPTGETVRPGELKIKKTTTNPVFCVESSSEGTAGTTYVDYSYTASYNAKLATFNFAIGYSDCDVFGNPAECNQERAKFDLDSLASQIFSTFKFTK